MAIHALTTPDTLKTGTDFVSGDVYISKIKSCCQCGCCNTALGLSGLSGMFTVRSHDGAVIGGPRLMLSAGGYGEPLGHKLTYFQHGQGKDFGQGLNWMVEDWPVIKKNTDSGDLVFLQSASSVAFFDGSTLSTKFGLHDALSHDSGNSEYKLATEDGRLLKFKDLDQAEAGVLKSIKTPGNQELTVESYTSKGRIGELQRSHTEGSDTTTESLDYSYNSDDLVQYVTLRRKVNAGSWDEKRRLEFTYYGASSSHGSHCDLETIKTQVPDGQGGWTTIETTYFRYYKDGDSNGFAHGLKYAVGPEAYQRLDDAVADPLTATDSQVADYADDYFEYDSFHRVTKHKVNGGSLESTYDFTISTHADGENNWKFKTTETLPDGSQRIAYANHIGQVIVEEFKDGSDSWLNWYKYNSDYQVIQHAQPSAVTSYDDSQADMGVSLKASAGLIHVTDYYTTTGSGAADGHVEYEKIKNGSTGNEIKLRKFEYAERTADGRTVHPISKETVYRNDDGTGAIDTSYSFSWHSGTVQMEERVTTLPAVPTSQNGSGSSNTRTERFDSHGNLIWTKDERGFIHRNKYDIITGALTQTIQDVDTTTTSDEPSGWSTPSGGGKHLVSDFEHDDLGRITQELGPEHEVDIDGTATDVRTASWTVYDDENHQVRTAQGYATGANWDTFTLVNPVSISKMDEAGRTIEQIQATRASTSGKLAESDTFAQSSYVRWSSDSYDDEGKREHSRVYHAIPSTGAGSSGTNYDQTDFDYDASDRQNKTKSPGGTITRTVFNSRSLVEKVYVGTDDTSATDSDPTGGGAQNNNMVLVSETEFDSGNDGGDSLVTKQTQHVDSSTTRVTSFTNDWRGRQTDIDGEEEFYQKNTHDNLDRVTQVDRHDTTSGGNLIARNKTSFDDLGPLVYETKRYAVDPSTGTVGDSLTDNTWYDEAGNVIKQHPAGSEAFTKFEYDSLGRQAKQFVGFDTDETAYADADDVVGDTIFEQSETDYDDAGNVIETRLRRRHHDATGTGELTTPSGSQPKARVSYVAHYADAVGRSQAVANYGTNADTALSRASTIPTRSDTILVTSTEYNDNGEAYKTTDPAGKEDRTEFDDAGRVTKQIENYTDGDPTTGGDDEDVTVEFTYTADGQRATIVAKQSSSSDDQTTKYIYGTSTTDSDVARSDLLRGVIYPDSDDTGTSGTPATLGDGADETYDRVEHKYNRLGEVKETKDQNGSVHSFDFDKLGRVTHDRITTLGSGVDGAVRRISTTYEVRGMVEKITSYDNATVGSGTVVNEVVREYNDAGLLNKEYQEHDGAKDANTPYVGYNYDEMASGGEFTKGLRLKSLRYPDGRLVHHTYGSSGSDADNLNRLDAIQDDNNGSPGTTLAAFTYLGAGMVVIEDLEEPDVKLDLFGGTSGSYAGLDRFDRVVDQRWYDYGASEDRDRFKYGYNRASNRTWKENVVAANNGKDFDEFYTYDGVHRLKNFDRGDLNAGKTAISGTPSREEDWTLDALGNWTNYIQKTDGTTDLDQDRTVNQVNEITDIDEATGTAWPTPAYDKNGNMTAMPQPADLSSSFANTWDPWNRLVKVKDGATTVADYAYDGLMRRVTKDVDSTVRHFYYTARWQAIEERLDSSTDPDRQFIWGPLYIDHLILRDRDTTDPPNGTLNERIYALQDANWNVTCLTDNNGDAIERYTYEPYGVASVFDGGFGSRSKSSYGWEYRFTSRSYEQETGDYSYRLRCFDVNLGRFQSRDPISYSDGLNLSAFMHQNPINSVDPFGFQAIRIDRSGSSAGCCGPDVTDWFLEQLTAVRKFASGLLPGRLKTFNNMFRTLKFEEADHGKSPSSDNCPSSGCERTVMLCGGCIDVTELGNIAFGFAASDELALMLWGGLYAEVVGKGRGFDRFEEVAAALIGYHFRRATADYFGARPDEFAKATRADFCSLLAEPAEAAGFIPNRRILQGNWLYDVFGKDVIGAWNAKHFGGENLLDAIMFLREAGRQLVSAKGGFREMAKVGCGPCDEKYSGPDVKFAEGGTVSWS